MPKLITKFKSFEKGVVCSFKKPKPPLIKTPSTKYFPTLTLVLSRTSTKVGFPILKNYY